MGGWREAKRLGANPWELRLQHPEPVFDVEAGPRGHPGFQGPLPLAFRSPGRAGTRVSRVGQGEQEVPRTRVDSSPSASSPRQHPASDSTSRAGGSH